ncbi:MAG TPA: hypothetical protein VIY49_27830 [Bryobacteraceae bacterium]
MTRETRKGERMLKAGKRTLREWQRTRNRFRRTRQRARLPEAHLEPRSAMHQPEGMQVELIWRENGEIRRKLSSWRTRPATKEALSEWVEEYLRLVDEGYQPSGYATPPRPHCARILLNGRVLAEWMGGKQSLRR